MSRFSRQWTRSGVVTAVIWLCPWVSAPAKQPSIAIANPADFPGTDACEKISAAIAALPDQGGIVDARSMSGAQACKSDPFASAAKPVHLKFGATTITSSATWTIPSGTILEGLGPNQSSLSFEADAEALAWGLRLSRVSNVEISGLLIQSTRAHHVAFGIGIANNSSSVKIHGNRFAGLGDLDIFAKPRGAIYMTDVSDIWITDNEFTRNGHSPCAGTSYEIVAGYNASRNTNLHILQNRIHDSYTNISISLFDTSYTEVIGNNIDQNNQRFEPKGSISEISRSGNIVTVTTDDTKPIYAGGDWNTTVNIEGAGESSFDGIFTPVPLKVVDAQHFTYPQPGADQRSTGGSYRLSANNDGYGILFYTTNLATAATACQHNIVQRNTVTNSAGQGILLQGSSDTLVGNNELLNTDIQTDGGSHPVGAIAVNAGNPGMRFSDRVIIRDNQIDTTWRSGIDVANSRQITITNNIFQHVGTSRAGNASCIRLRFAEPDATISGNTCTGGLRGFYADYDLLRPTISENSFAGWGGDHGAAGMFFKGVLRGAVIEHNAIKSPAGEGPGILVLNRTSAENILENNDIDLSGARHGSGIDYRGLQAKITGNRVLNAPEDGISVESATDARVEGNTITHAGRRAIAKGGFGNSVRDNVER